VILQAYVSCPGTTFEDGAIQWKICSEDQCQILPNGNEPEEKSNERRNICESFIYIFFLPWALGCVDHEVDLSGSKWCVLSAELSRGKGDVAWQHAQIARQSTKGSNDEYPLVFRILFGSAD
jgi:peptide-N4-(N-acetyl-beta-glucosaminyl)asparagine amidase